MTDNANEKWQDQRLDRIERELEHIHTLPTEVALVNRSIDALAASFSEFKTDVEQHRREGREDIRALRTAVIGFALTVAGSSLAAIIAVATGLVG